MSWTSGNFTFPEKTSKDEMMAEIIEQLSEERGKRDPIYMPLSLLGGNYPILDSEEEAEEYMRDAKYMYDRDKSYGIRFYHYKASATSSKIKDLKRRIEETKQKLTEYEAAHSIKTFKAEYIGCPECGSKLKKELLKADTCPLCRSDMRSKTTLNTLQGYRTKIKDLEKQCLQEEKKVNEKRRKSGEIYWFINANAYLG